MANGSSKEAPEDQVESFIDELIGQIFSESGAPAGSAMRGMATATTLFDTAFGATGKASRTSLLERVLVAQAFAGELAEALAPALAEQLAPRLMKALEELMPAQAPDKAPASGGRPGQGRKPESK
jgi:hypothetical protein